MDNNSRENLNIEFLKENKCIFKKYKPIKKIGYGAFGMIYTVIRLTDKKVFAMKTEKKNPFNKILESESYFLLMLQGGLGIPKLITFGHTKSFNILIETLLGENLLKIFFENKKSNISDVCLVAIQILDRLEWIHSKNIIYRDIKPENFLIGIDDPNVIYIVDFGLCKKYRSSKTGKHILPKLTGKFTGTLKYSSHNVTKGKESSRRDDLISLGYMLIYLYKKDLPWEKTFKNLRISDYFEIIYLKDTNNCGKLCNNMPQEFTEYLKYCRNLKFEQDPNYSYLRSLFTKILFNINLSYKKITFSWINQNKKKLLLGIPKNIFKRKESPQNRLYKILKQESIKTLNRKVKSETNMLDSLNFGSSHHNILHNKTHISTLSNIYSDQKNAEKNSSGLKNISINNLKMEPIKKVDTMVQREEKKKPQNNINVFIIKKNNKNFYFNNTNNTTNNIKKTNNNISPKKEKSNIKEKTNKNIVGNSAHNINLAKNNSKLKNNKIKKIPIPNLKIIINNSNQKKNLGLLSPKLYTYRKNNLAVSPKMNSYRKNQENIIILSYENKDNKDNIPNSTRYRSPLIKYNNKSIINNSNNINNKENIFLSNSKQIRKIELTNYISPINKNNYNYNYQFRTNNEINNETNNFIYNKLLDFKRKRCISPLFTPGYLYNNNNRNNSFNKNLKTNYEGLFKKKLTLLNL